jgi:hypothetical protein
MYKMYVCMFLMYTVYTYTVQRKVNIITYTAFTMETLHNGSSPCNVIGQNAVG